MLKDYSLKETKLGQIKREKLSIAQQPADSTTVGRRASTTSADDTIIQGSTDADLQQLEMQEGVLVKQIQGLTPIVQRQILANF